MNILIGLLSILGIGMLLLSLAGVFLPHLRKYKVSGLVGGLLLLLLGQSLFYARPGYQYYIVSPFGQRKAVLDAGVKIITPFSTVQEWEKYIDVKTVDTGESEEGIEGVIRGPIGVRFIDQVTADVSIAARFQIPEAPSAFIEMVETFRHPKNLANNTLIPTIREQVYNVTQMFRAEAYVSGASQDFRATLDDALKNGTFIVDREEIRDTVFEDLSVVEVLTKPRAIKELRTRIQVIKRMKGGVPLREEHDITKNNIIIAQVIVEDVFMEPKFREKLQQQRDISAEKSIEAQKIETARIAQQRIVVEGERDKAAERVEQEKAQVSKLIAIETQVKEEESKRQLAEIALRTERLLAEKRKVAADAKKYEILQADEISAERKYILDNSLEQTKHIAEAIKGLTLPSTYIAGGGNAGNNSVEQYLQLLIAQMANTQSQSKKAGGN